MAEPGAMVQEGAAWRTGLVRKHALLRGVGRHAGLTLRAARFAARMQGGAGAIDFAGLAQQPVWRLDREWDRERLAEIAGLLAARPELLRTIAGPMLRELADRYTPTLLEAVLDADLPDGDGVPEPRDLSAGELRRTGQALLDMADDGAARAIVDQAVLLCTGTQAG